MIRVWYALVSAECHHRAVRKTIHQPPGTGRVWQGQARSRACWSAARCYPQDPPPAPRSLPIVRAEQLTPVVRRGRLVGGIAPCPRRLGAVARRGRSRAGRAAVGGAGRRAGRRHHRHPAALAGGLQAAHPRPLLGGLPCCPRCGPRTAWSWGRCWLRPRRQRASSACVACGVPACVHQGPQGEENHFFQSCS